MTRRAGHVPLVVFTTLAITGAGAIAWAGLSRGRSTPPDPTVHGLGLGLLALGLAVSVLHLGRRDRAHLASRGLARVSGPGGFTPGFSAVSAEGALGLATLVFGTISLFEVVPAWMIPYAGGFAGSLAIVFLWSIGHVYDLPGQVTWTGPSAYTPASGGVAFGAILAASLARRPDLFMVVLAVAADTFVFLLRWRRITILALDGPAEESSWFERRHELLAARLLLLDAIPLIMTFVWPTPLAALVAAAGILVDRSGFYALERQHTTEREVDRVERVIGGSGPTGPE